MLAGLPVPVCPGCVTAAVVRGNERDVHCFSVIGWYVDRMQAPALTAGLPQ
jgi:hypothetical protein